MAYFNLARFIREQMHADAPFIRLKFGFKSQVNLSGFFIIKQITRPGLCSVLLQSTKEAVHHSRSKEKHSRLSPYTSLVLYRLLRALQQNRAQSRILYLLNSNSLVLFSIKAQEDAAAQIQEMFSFIEKEEEKYSEKGL